MMTKDEAKKSIDNEMLGEMLSISVGRRDVEAYVPNETGGCERVVFSRGEIVVLAIERLRVYSDAAKAALSAARMLRSMVPSSALVQCRAHDFDEAVRLIDEASKAERATGDESSPCAK